MKPHFFILTFLSLICASLAQAQKADSDEAEEPSAQRRTAIRILAEPKSSRPFNWQRGDKVTIGVRLTSAEGTRVIGVATDVDLMATKSFPNRIEMMLKLPPKDKEKVLAAAKMSEYWFEVMPFKRFHVKTLDNDVNLNEFLKKNKDHRPVGAADWGIGNPTPITAPIGSELPTRQ